MGVKHGAYVFVVVDLVTLKLLVFRLVLTYFGTTTLHQIAPFFIKIFPGEHASGPP